MYGNGTHLEVEGCFRAGDVVRAKVLSLGDARSFYLTTASDALGVCKRGIARLER